MVKAEISGFVWLAFVVMIGITAIIITMENLSSSSSPETRSLELASKIALYVDSLSTTENGNVKLDMGEYEYNIEVQEKDSRWRTIGRALLPDRWIDKRGYYIAVTAHEDKSYIDDDEKKEETNVFLISSYKLEDDHVTLLENVTTVCIIKEDDKDFAEVKECA